MKSEPFTVISLVAGISSVVYYFLMLIKIDINPVLNNKKTITQTAHDNNKVHILKLFYIINSSLGALFLSGVMHHYMISDATLYMLILIMVSFYWIAGYSIGSYVHEIAGIGMGVSVISLTLGYGITLFRYSHIAGILSLIIFLSLVILSFYFIISNIINNNLSSSVKTYPVTTKSLYRLLTSKQYIMTFQIEHLFSLLLSLWILIICTLILFELV